MSFENRTDEIKVADEMIARHLLGCTMYEIRDRARAMLKEYAEWHNSHKANGDKGVTDNCTIPVVVCSCCGKNTPEICGSCVSDIAQETGDAAYNSR